MSGTIAFPETIEEIAALYAALHALSPSPGVGSTTRSPWP
jgi:hypothetical protein